MKLKYKVKVDISGGYQLHAFYPMATQRDNGGQDDYLCMHIPEVPAGQSLRTCVDECLFGIQMQFRVSKADLEDLTDWEELKRVDALRSPTRGGLTRPATKEDIDLHKFRFTPKET